MRASTTTALASSPGVSAFGQAITFTATVSGVAPAPGTPTGRVDFTDGATDLTPGGINLVAGQATSSTAALAIGTHTIAATYGGDANFSTSQGNDSLAPQVIQQTPTSTLVSSSADPSVFGQQVTFTATVSAVFPAAGTPTGSVTFTEGGTVVAAGVALNASAKATLQTMTLGFGSHLITATYSGDSTFSASASAPANQAVNPDATTTSLKSSLGTSVFGQAVTFTATVLAALPGSGMPKGVVTFEDGLSVPGVAVLNASGQATFSSTSLSVASHTIIAAYGGDGRFAFKGSSSSALAQTVTKAGSSTSLKVSVDPSAFGQAVVFTATVVASAPGGGTPAGAVQFKQGVTILSTVPLNALSQAAFQTIALPVGNNTITAVYLGNASFLGSTSTGLTQAVTPDATLPVVKSSLNPAVVGQTVTLTAIVRPGPPGSGTPTGTVTFFDSATALGTGTLTAGQATFSTASLSAGGHVITAVYAGGTHFTGNTSPGFGQVVRVSATAPVQAAIVAARAPKPQTSDRIRMSLSPELSSTPPTMSPGPGQASVVVGTTTSSAFTAARVLASGPVDAFFAAAGPPKPRTTHLRAKPKPLSGQSPDWLGSVD